MKKLKIYLDTSVISYLFADDTPEKKSHTLTLWNDIIDDKYDIFISTTTVSEIEACKEPKREMMLEKIRMIKFNILSETKEVTELANEYIKNNVLSSSNFDDCLHISFAVINECDLIISWNFKHLVNYKTIKNVKIVNSINNYKEIGIISPTMIIEEGDISE